MTTGASPGVRAPGLASKAFGKLRRLGLITVLLCIWQYVSLFVLDATSRTLLPPPTTIFTAAWELISSGELYRHARDSLKREMVAFLWASISIPIGIAMGWSRVVDEQMDTIFEMLRPIPPLAWIPLAILWLGLGDSAKIFLIWVAAFTPSVINTYAGVRNIDLTLLEAARVHGARPGRLMAEVLVPGALPMIFTGLRLSLQASWTTLVAAELVGSFTGLGKVLSNAALDINPGMILFAMVWVGILGAAMTRGLEWLEVKALPWLR